MAKPFITIIGLGVIGGSMGLGLQREEIDFEIVGHDKQPDAAGYAKRQGAVQRTEWNLHRACEGSELIVLATPLNELDTLLDQIAEDLKPGVLVLALSDLMEPALESGAKHLPSNVHFVVGHPIVTGISGTMSMRADLYDEVTFALAPGLQTDPSAVQLASDFVERVGAKPLFVDVHEHDGIVAGVEQLPQIVAAALMRMSSQAPGWREARRLAGRKFAQATDLNTTAGALFEAARTNRENLLHRIDLLQQELAEWKRLLSADDEEPAEGQDSAASATAGYTASDDKEADPHELLRTLESVERERERWAAQAQLQNWDETTGTAEEASAAAPGMLRQMFFGGLMGRGGRSDSR